MLTRITSLAVLFVFTACGASSKPGTAPTTAGQPTTASSTLEVSGGGACDGRVAVRRAPLFHCADMRNGLSGYRVYTVESGPARGKQVVEHYGHIDGFGAGDVGEWFVGKVVIAAVTIPEKGWPNSCAGMTFDGRVSALVETTMPCD